MQTAGVVREALVSLTLRASVGSAASADACRALVCSWSGALVPAGSAGPAAALPPLTALLHAFANAPTSSKKVICSFCSVTFGVSSIT